MSDLDYTSSDKLDESNHLKLAEQNHKTTRPSMGLKIPSKGGKTPRGSPRGKNSEGSSRGKTLISRRSHRKIRDVT